MNLPWLLDSHRISEFSFLLRILTVAHQWVISIQNTIIFFLLNICLDVNEEFPLFVGVFLHSEMWEMIPAPPKAGRN